MGYKPYEDRIRDIYDIKEESDVIGRGFDHAYAQVRAMAAENKKSRVFKKLRRSIVVGSLSAAACVLILFSVNLAFPAFAESIPVIGSIFRYINESARANWPGIGDYERIPDYLQSIDDASATDEREAYGVTIKEAYSDGRFIHASAELYSETDPNDENIEWYYDIYINGVKIDMWSNEYRPWTSVGENRYVNTDLSIYMPEEYQADGEIYVEYHLFMLDISNRTIIDEKTGEVSPPEELERFEVSFTVETDESDTVQIEGPVEQNGIIFRKFYSTPAGAEVSLDTPPMYVSEAHYAHVYAFRRNGEQLSSPGSSSANSEYSEDLVNLTTVISGLKREDTEIVISLMEDMNGTITVVAEFLLNLENGTAMPSTEYQDPQSGLYWDSEVPFSKKRLSPSYAATDEAISSFSGEYMVEFITDADYTWGIYLNVLTKNDYRDITAELFDEGGHRIAGGASGKELAWYYELEHSAFIPYERYDIDHYTMPVYKEKFEIYTNEVQDRTVPKDGLNAQIIFMDNRNGQLAPGDVYTLRLTDTVTGMLLHEESFAVTLPEIELADGEEMIRLRGNKPVYVVLNGGVVVWEE